MAKSYKQQTNEEALKAYNRFKNGEMIEKKDVTKKFINYLIDDNDEAAKIVDDGIKKAGGIEEYKQSKSIFWDIKEAIIDKFIPYLSKSSAKIEKDPFISAYNRFYSEKENIVEENSEEEKEEVNELSKD